MNDCSKFGHCRAPLCPLDRDVFQRVYLPNEPVCFFMLEAVKTGAERRFKRGRCEQTLWEIIHQTLPTLLLRYAVLRKPINRARKTASRMGRVIRRGCAMLRSKPETRKTKSRRKLRCCQCPSCGLAAPATLFTPGWLENFHQLAARHSELGFGPDLAALTLIELHGLYLWLSRATA
jgi:hypothetical protein